MDGQTSISTIILMGVQVLICGVGLLGVTLALIFSPQFRKDMLAGEGKASLLGFLSVEGATLLALSGLLLGGFLYPTWQLQKNLADQLAQKTEELKKKTEELKKVREEFEPGTIRLLGNVEGAEEGTEIKVEVCAGPWLISVDGNQVNKEITPNLKDYRVQLTAAGVVSGSIPISRTRIPDERLSVKPIQVIDGIADIGTIKIPKPKVTRPPGPIDKSKERVKEWKY